MSLKKSFYFASAFTLSMSLTTFQQSIAQETVYPALPGTTRAGLVKFPDEIVVKFKAQVVPSSANATSQNSSTIQAFAAIPQLEFNPLFNSLPKAAPTALAKSAQALTVFDQYYTAPVPLGANADELIKQLKSSPLVQEAYLKPQPAEVPALPAPNSTPVQANNDPYFPLQGYAQPAAQGINSVYAWEFEGGDGKGIKWVDVEQGWAFGHEDLAAHNIQLLPGGANYLYFSHGTAVLGQVSAVDNTIGHVGLASKAKPYASGQFRTVGGYNSAQALLDAATVLSAGDVLLIESQINYPTASGYMPLEVYPAEFDAVQYLTSIGITVVAAAGNGSVDLDSFQDTNGKFVFNPNSPDFKDSGAILVGAADSTVPHYRAYFSNYGNRLDTFSWGFDVATLDALDANSTTGYQTGFNGTSSASPIVTAAAISVQGIAKAKYGATYSPVELRRLLRAANYGTPSSNPAGNKIGYQPNLREIIDNYLVTPGTVPVDTVAPAIPLNLNVSSFGPYHITVSWNAATDNVAVHGYDVYVNGATQPVVSTSLTTADLTGLTPATIYTIRIKTRDGSNNLSAASAPLSVSTQPSPVCAGNGWSASTTYTTGNKASYNGVLYEAKWWTQNQRPDLNSGSGQVWTVVGPC